MKRGLATAVAAAAAVAATGCDITVRPFEGTVLQIEMSTSSPLPSGEHLELWARTAHDDIARINARFEFEDKRGLGRPTEPIYAYGLIIRPAITMDDPCIIDSQGRRLTHPEAYDKPVTVHGITQSPEEQAAVVRTRIAQLTQSSFCDPSLPPPNCGAQIATLYAVLPYALPGEPPIPDPPVIPPTASPEERLNACRAYWASSRIAYTPNPAQLTAPLHGAVWGYLPFQSQMPVSAFTGFRLDSNVNLNGLRELFLTRETIDAADSAAGRLDGVDAHARGPIYLQGYPDRGGNWVVHFSLLGPTASGTAVLFTDLTSDPVQF